VNRAREPRRGYARAPADPSLADQGDQNDVAIIKYLTLPWWEGAVFIMDEFAAIAEPAKQSAGEGARNLRRTRT